MDLELEFDEREKEGMELTIDGLTITVPEHLVEERMRLTGQTREIVQEKFERKARDLKKCFIRTNTYSPSTFEQRYVDYLDSDMAIYRP